jgi:hypothetical protein
VARRKILPEELVAVAATIGANESGQVDRDRLARMPEVRSIYLNGKECDDAKCNVCQAFSLDLMSAEALEDVVSEKESKAPEYPVTPTGC